MNPTTMLEVRCCCQPQKLLGYLPFTQKVGPVPAGGHFKLKAQQGELHFPPYANGLNPDWYGAQERSIELPIAVFSQVYIDEHGERDVDTRFAYKADGVDIETLRLISDFVESPVQLEKVQRLLLRNTIHDFKMSPEDRSELLFQCGKLVFNMATGCREGDLKDIKDFEIMGCRISEYGVKDDQA